MNKSLSGNLLGKLKNAITVFLLLWCLTYVGSWN